MKTTIWISMLLLVSTITASAQSLNDAKKAYDSEQFQKAKTILVALEKNQTASAEANFFLGNIYVTIEEADSAKASYEKGIAKDAQYTLNYVGLGNLALSLGDTSTANKHFEKALSLIKKKDYITEMYIGHTYAQFKYYSKATKYLENAATKLPKDDLLYIYLGDVYLAQKRNNEALTAYEKALSINRNSLHAIVAKGVIWKMALNFEASERELNEALKLDANYGPAYRELAETYLRWGNAEPSKYNEKIKQALSFYKKYLEFTDLSINSRMRYADFLILAKEYKALEEEANIIAKMENKNPRIYRYLGYAAYENGNYEAANQALETFFKEVSPSRIIAKDYQYLGLIELKLGKDSLGIQNLKKSVDLDSTGVGIFSDLAKEQYKAKNYNKAADCYEVLIRKKAKVNLQDEFNFGMSCFWAYNQEVNKKNQDSTVIIHKEWLTKADTAFSHINQKSPSTAMAYYYRAKVARFKEKSAEEGLATPFYQKYLEILETKSEEKEKSKRQIAEAYNYFAESVLRKDYKKAKEFLEKALVVEPDNKTAKQVLEQLNAPPAPAPKAKKK